MIVFPAIDIKNGQCVRLYKGDFDTVEKVFENPLLSAENFKKEKASHLHLVDLDGSVEARPVSFDLVSEIKNKTGLFCEVGGGIRDMGHVEKYVAAGIDRVILGSAALRDPDFVREAVKQYGRKISVGIDARNGKVCADGWLRESSADFIEFAVAMEQAGVSHIIYTDIDTDGTLNGPNFAHLEKLSSAVEMDITASGGIKDVSHINKLREMGLYGAICGKSLYSGTLRLSEVL